MASLPVPSHGKSPAIHYYSPLSLPQAGLLQGLPILPSWPCWAPGPVNSTWVLGQTILRYWRSDPGSWKPFEKNPYPQQGGKAHHMSIFLSEHSQRQNQLVSDAGPGTASLSEFSVLLFEAWKLGTIFTAYFRGKETRRRSHRTFRFMTGDGKRTARCSSSCRGRSQPPAPVYLLTSFE